jgi:hypothetical protein
MRVQIGAQKSIVACPFCRLVCSSPQVCEIQVFAYVSCFILLCRA